MELAAILNEMDFTPFIEYNGNLGNGLSRSECESIVNSVIGQNTPNNDYKFLVKSTDDKYFVVFYVKSIDKFLFEKLTAR